MEKLVNIAAPVFAMAVLILLDLSSAAEYKVGDNFGWSYDVNLKARADSKTFNVGDVLVFRVVSEIKGTKYYIWEYHCNFDSQKLMIHVP